MENNIYIYALVDPRDKQIKYIGATTKGEERYKRHLQEYYLKKSKKKINWIKTLGNQNLVPTFEILEYCTLDNLAETEEFFSYLRPDMDIDLELKKRQYVYNIPFWNNSGHRKKILEITTNTEYESIACACKALKIDTGDLSNVLRGNKDKKLKGYKFKYV